MLIPDEIISKNPTLESIIKQVEEGVSKISGSSEEKNELSSIIDETIAFSSTDYYLGLLPEGKRSEFMETYTSPVTFEETIAFVQKNTGKSDEEIKNGLVDALEGTFSETLSELRIPDEINTETKLPVK